MTTTPPPTGDNPNPQAQANPLTIHGQYIKDLSFENPRAPQSLIEQKQPQLTLNVNVTTRQFDTKTFEVTLTVEANALTPEKEPLFMLELVYAGTVTIGDRTITNLPPEEVARAGVGYVPQVDDVFAPLTVRENLEMGGYLLHRGEVAPRIERVLAVFPRLSGMLGRSAGKLSGGERKMLAMGRVLMLDPGVFLLDEPTANLAPMIAASLLEEHVRGLAASGAAVLIVEQRAKAVLAISDRTYVLGGGEVRMEGTPAELSASPEFVESFLGGGSRRPARSGEG